MYNRFGNTAPLRIGQQYEDTGLLQDMFQFKYREHAKLSDEQLRMPEASEVWVSNFMSYARNHAILALASVNPGTEDPSVPRIVRNLFRLYVDTYSCAGVRSDDDTVPAVMGFTPHAVTTKEDRPVILYAGGLSCINSKLEEFCASGANRGERVCFNYKQLYLNDACMLYTRLLRSQRRAQLHEDNFRKVQARRPNGYTRAEWNTELINLQDAYIEFLQTTLLSMMIEFGADLRNMPLNLLEPRELAVPTTVEDTDLIGNDFLTPATRHMVKDMDFGGDNLSRKQLAILSLMPPHARIFGTLRLNQKTEIKDLEHVKKLIQKETIKNNDKAVEVYKRKLIEAEIARQLLEVDGPFDPSFDPSSIKDPLVESEGITTKFTTTNAQQSSTLSQSIQRDMLRKDRSPASSVAMNKREFEDALQAVRDRVERDHQKSNGTTPRVKCL
ncbi:MAG: hypothetical protein VXW74_00285, partial [Candidatus Thermoplasmatota archaeon]|nr:hypothetical protein [Candidatus Thermoplasmatota archaeon]